MTTSGARAFTRRRAPDHQEVRFPMTNSVYSISAALLKASANIQAYARQVELRDPIVSKPFYAGAAWLKTAATIGGAL